MNEQPWPPPSAPDVNAAFRKAALGAQEPQRSDPPPERPADDGRTANDNPRLVLNPPGMLRAAPGPAQTQPRPTKVDPERLARIERMREGLLAKEQFNKTNEQGRTL